MPIRVPCPHCGKTIVAPDKAAGRDARCPGCQGVVAIPQAVIATTSAADIDFDVPDSFDPPAPTAVTSKTPTSLDPKPAEERIRVSCGNCGKLLAAPAKALGKSVKCPNCQNPIKVQRPGDGAAASDRASGSKSSPQNNLFNLFDEPAAPESETADYDPNDPFAHFDQLEMSDAGGGVHAAMPPVVQGVKRKKRRKPAEEDQPVRRARPQADGVGDWTRIFLYAYMGLAMIPLAVTLFLSDSVLSGTHLPEGSQFHWVYAGLSIAGFMTLLLVSVRSPDAGPIFLLLIGLFTGTIGIVMLLILQAVAFFSLNLHVYGRSIIVLFVLLVKFIGFSYYSALSPDSSFWMSAFGFTFGVGLCEELCKIIPVVWYLQNNRDASWKGACLVGLASGIGFGVSEGITYSADFYNGSASWEIYVVRFVSCVALHAAWTATIACTMYRRSDLGGGEFFDICAAIAIWIGLPTLMHGFYDTLLKHEYNGWALVTAILTIAWMAWTVERAARDGALSTV